VRLQRYEISLHHCLIVDRCRFAANGHGANFDTGARSAHTIPCQTVGWPLFTSRRREESPGSTEMRCRLTAGGGDPRDSATENIPPSPSSFVRDYPCGIIWAVRVKWCGKSAPRCRQRWRQGKPHREQDQVGAAGTISQIWCQADLRAAARVGRARRSATNAPDEWPSPPPRLARRRDRTRLTDRLAIPRLEQKRNILDSNRRPIDRPSTCSGQWGGQTKI